MTNERIEESGGRKKYEKTLSTKNIVIKQEWKLVMKRVGFEGEKMAKQTK